MSAGGSWLARVPKVELHVHLEGAIPHPALFELIAKYGGDPSVPDVAALARRFVFTDFAHFIDTWVWKQGFLREYEDFTHIAAAVAADLARQNVRYAEMFFSPSTVFKKKRLDPQRLTEAVRAGLAREPGIRVALVADLVRDNGPAHELGVLERLADVKELGLIGIGIGGSEQLYPCEPFDRLYETARRFGFHTTAHAGEAAGADSIRAAVVRLGAERIGHGTRAGEDPSLLELLADKRVPLEMCPVSNLRTGVVSSLEEHPIRRYFDQGLLVTVNTDDPAMFGNSLAGEYALLEERLGFTRDETRELILNGVRASWLSDAEKAKMLSEFRAAF